MEIRVHISQTETANHFSKWEASCFFLKASVSFSGLAPSKQNYKFTEVPISSPFFPEHATPNTARFALSAFMEQDAYVRNPPE